MFDIQDFKKNNITTLQICLQYNNKILYNKLCNIDKKGNKSAQKKLKPLFVRKWIKWTDKKS